MDTCAAALDYYFNAMVVLTVLGAAGWLLVTLLFAIMYGMAKGHEAFKAEARAILKETGYFNDE